MCGCSFRFVVFSLCFLRVLSLSLSPSMFQRSWIAFKLSTHTLHPHPIYLQLVHASYSTTCMCFLFSSCSFQWQSVLLSPFFRDSNSLKSLQANPHWIIWSHLFLDDEKDKSFSIFYHILPLHLCISASLSHCLAHAWASVDAPHSFPLTFSLFHIVPFGIF